MVNKRIAEDIINFGQSLALFGPHNLFTGVLSLENTNNMEADEVIRLAHQSEYIVRELVRQLSASGVTPDNSECALLFQYVFDKVAEATYKTLVGVDVDTTFDVKEVFEYYEPDLPIHIQQKITAIVPRIAELTRMVLLHIEENDYCTDDLEVWLYPFLVLSSGISIKFVLEMNLDDDSQLEDFFSED